MPARARLLAALAPWVALAVLAAASAAAPGPSEARIRRQIVAAAHEAAAARSIAARAVAELRNGSTGRLAPFYRLEVRIEKGSTMKTEDRRFPPGRWNRPTNEVVTVGEGVWWREGSDRYQEATIDPSLVDGTTGELVALERAAKVGRNLSEVGANRYELTAPAATFNGPEAGHRPIRILVTLTVTGQLHRLHRIEGQGGIGFVAAETFTDFGRSFGISAPPSGTIVPGPAKHISTSDEFSELLGPSPFGD